MYYARNQKIKAAYVSAEFLAWFVHLWSCKGRNEKGMQSATEGVSANSQATISSRIRMHVYKNASKCPSKFPFQKDTYSVSAWDSLVLCPSFVSRLKKCVQKCFHPRYCSRQTEWVSSSESPSGLLFMANRMSGTMTLSELIFIAKNIQGYVLTNSTDNIVSSWPHSFSTIEKKTAVLKESKIHHPPSKRERKKVFHLTFRRRIKSRLPFASIIRRLTYSTRFQDKG